MGAYDMRAILTGATLCLRTAQARRLRAILGDDVEINQTGHKNDETKVHRRRLTSRMTTASESLWRQFRVFGYINTCVGLHALLQLTRLYTQSEV